MNNKQLQLALFRFAILAIPAYLIRFSIIGVPTNLFEVVALMTFAIWLTKKKKGALLLFSQAPNWIRLGIFLLLLGVVVGIIFSDNRMVGLGILKSWFVIPLIFSCAFAALHESKKEIEKSLFFIYLSTFSIAILGLGYKLMGLTTYDGRLSGPYASPNYLAMYLAPGLLLGTYFVFQKSKHRLFFMFSSFAILICLYFTFSYLTFIGLIASMSMVFFLLSKRKKRFLLLASFLSLALLVLIETNSSLKTNIGNYFNTSSRSSFASRIMIWKASAKMIEAHPFAGIGAGNFQTEYLDLQPLFPPYLEWAVPHPHNIFLAFWLQTGLLGLAGFLFLIFKLIIKLCVLIKKNKDPLLAASLLTFFAYFIISGLGDTLYWKNDLSVVFWVFFFLSVRLLETEN
jgi:O-antigen ligase